MKKIYVLNLDSRRLLVLAGILLLCLSIFFYIGIQIGAGKARQQETQQQFSNPPAEIPIVEPAAVRPAGKETGILEPRDEVVQHLSAETLPRDPLVREAERTALLPQIQEDPFIQPPPKRKAKNTPATKSATLSEKKVTGSEAKPGFYTIQVAAFLREQDARNLNSRLLSRGFASRVERGNRFWFVRVGKENRPEKLEAQAEKLRRESYDILIKKQET